MRTALTYCISILIALTEAPFVRAQDSTVHATFRLEGVSLRASLDSLMRWYPAFLVYMDRDVEGTTVNASCANCEFEKALERVLEGTQLTWSRMGNQYVLAIRRIEHARPTGTVLGTVRDSLTGDPVPGATVYLEDSTGQDFRHIRWWCPTNNYGFYSLRRIPQGRRVLVVRAIGYSTVALDMNIPADSSLTCNVMLRSQEITLQEITVEGERASFSGTDAVSRGIYIRSTPSDRNTYLLDGTRIYNPSHFGGVLSTFNKESLNDVQVVVGGLPPDYGGEVGGILDCAIHDGNSGRLAGTAGTGSLGSHLSLEGPLANGTSFSVSGRRGYPDPAIPLVPLRGKPGQLGSYEAIGKVTQRLSGSSTLSIGGYLGRDSYTNSAGDASRWLGNDFSWGNGMLNLRWLDIATPSLFLSASAEYTRYDFSLGQVLTGDIRFQSGLNRPSTYAIEDISIRANAEHYYDEEHTFRAGVALTQHRLSGEIDAFATQIAPLPLGGYSSWEASLYAQDQWRMLPSVMAELGARATSYTGRDGDFSAIDPRFSLLISLNERTRLYTSLTAVTEFLHPYRNSGVFVYYPSIFWYPSTEQGQPSTSLQGTVGIERTMDAQALVGSAEVFSRTTHNLHDAVLDSAATDLNSSLILGTGSTYGIELSLRKPGGDFAGSLTYSLSWATQQFAELNNGNPFVPRFDRRHEVHLEVAYTRLENWVFGLLCVVASDLAPSTPPSVTGTRILAAPTGGTGPASTPPAEIIDVNGARIPGFQRIELNAARTFALWGTPCRIELRMLNGYGLIDPFVWTVHDGSNVKAKWDIALQEPGLFPLYPSLSLTVRF